MDSKALPANGRRLTGDKVYTGDLARAVEYLVEAGAELDKIAAYIIIGHPESSLQDVEGSIRFAGSLGLRVMLSEFSPIPGTPDGDKCDKWVDMSEPLQHNKIFFTSVFLGHDKTQEIKNLCREQNRRIGRQAAGVYPGRKHLWFSSGIVTWGRESTLRQSVRHTNLGVQDVRAFGNSPWAPGLFFLGGGSKKRPNAECGITEVRIFELRVSNDSVSGPGPDSNYS